MKKHLQNWLYVDTRTLALFRIVFGFMGLCDVLRRFSVIDVFYSNAGMDFRRYVTGKYSIKYFTLLDHIQGSLEVHIFFVVTAICFVFLILGYKTRVFQLFSAIGLISIHNVAIIVENGADMVFNNYLIWSLFLPLGTSWSIDSIRKSLKNNPEYDTEGLNTPIQPSHRSLFHIGYIACLVQLSMIYFYNYINKTGPMWDDGSAIYYMYQLDTFLTYIGEWIFAIFPQGVFTLLTTTTIYIEIIATVAILSPIFQPYLRRIIFIVFILFHLIIGISINIGMFSWVMMAVLILLLGSKEIELLRKLLGQSHRKYTVFYDRDCGFCHLTARILKRMDGFSRLTWADKLAEGKTPPNLQNLLVKTIVVWDPKTEETWTRHTGFSRIISALPFGRLFSWIFVIPVLEKIFGYMYDIIASNRTTVSSILSLPACGILQKEDVVISVKPGHPIIQKSKNVLFVSSNILAFVLLIGVIDYSTTKNQGFKDFISKEGKTINKARKSSTYKDIRRSMKRVLMYPRMTQQWNMFYSVPKTEKWILGEVTFMDGQSVLLFQNNTDIENRLHHSYLSPYSNQFWRKLFTRLGKSSYQKHIPKFKNWLKNTEYFSEYKGRKVKKVTLWQLSERSKGPNSTYLKRNKVKKKELKKSNKRNKKSKKTVKKKNNKITNRTIK